MREAVKPRVKAGTSKAAAIDRRVTFAESYIANGRNGLQAAIDAGFSEKGAGVAASRMLKDTKVCALLAELTEEHGRITGLTTERVLLECARLSFSDIRRFFNADGGLKPVDDLDDDCAAAISSIEVDELTGEDGQVIRRTKKLKLWDKNAALEKAMKHLGLYERDNTQRQPNLAIQVVLGK